MRDAPGALHPESVAALAEVREQRGKAILLLNRRGWSNFLSCRSCGRVWSCPNAMSRWSFTAPAATWPVTTAAIARAPPAVPGLRFADGRPPRCRDRASGPRAGSVFDDGEFPVFRLDAECWGRRRGRAGGDPARVRGAAAGSLIGTQMVAKGHDFPDVGLGIVLDADATLRFPDFRAEERTFALISQLAGRAGRGSAGRVLVQTIAPEARAIRHAARHDSAGFIADELGRRAALRYPPFAHLIRIVFAGESSDPPRLAAAEVRELLVDALAAAPGTEAPATVLGPASLFRLRGRERQVLVVKAAERRAAVRAVGAAVARVAANRAHAEVSFSVDVDPQ